MGTVCSEFHWYDLNTVQVSLYEYVRIYKKGHNFKVHVLGLTTHMPCISTLHRDPV